MLAEERKSRIVDFVNERKAVTATELMQEFNASEATIRRDLTELDQKGLISKVHGGAVTVQTQILMDNKVSERAELNLNEKQSIAKYAASLIQDHDLVFLDAGTTTGYIIDYIQAKGITIVTNAIIHAYKASSLGFVVYLTGGRLKSSTEALVGSDCFDFISRFNFSIGFYGTNGVSHRDGFSTPDIEEAKIKEFAITRTAAPYILCDHTKFHITAPVRFAQYKDACIISTGNIPDSYKKDSTVVIVE